MLLLYGSINTGFDAAGQSLSTGSKNILQVKLHQITSFYCSFKMQTACSKN